MSKQKKIAVGAAVVVTILAVVWISGWPEPARFIGEHIEVTVGTTVNGEPVDALVVTFLLRQLFGLIYVVLSLVLAAIALVICAINGGFKRRQMPSALGVRGGNGYN